MWFSDGPGGLNRRLCGQILVIFPELTRRGIHGSATDGDTAHLSYDTFEFPAEVAGDVAGRSIFRGTVASAKCKSQLFIQYT